MIPYVEFARQHASKSRERFLQDVRVPHLLVPFVYQTSENGNEVETPILTRRFDLESQLGQARENLWILPVEKQATKNAFTMMITLGRARNNDLIVPHPNVSKFHAYFRELTGSWTIHDANSLNGTSVDGHVLPPERGHPLRTGAEIMLGGTLALEFLLPETLHERLVFEGPDLLSGHATGRPAMTTQGDGSRTHRFSTEDVAGLEDTHEDLRL